MMKENGEQNSGGVTIVPPSTILAHPHTRVFLAARKYGKRYQQEIVAQLKEMGVASERIVRVDREVIERMERHQYFDLPALHHDAHECFVDVGACDGDTAKYFAEWAGTFEHIYAFEPDPASRQKCKEVLQVWPEEQTTLLPYGAWNESKELRFHNSGDGKSHIWADGDIVIPVTMLDEALAGKRVTFIKMDIEGAENEALEGAQNIIREQHPKLAVCVYHKPHDIVEIPMRILAIDPSYQFYLRHYALRIPETVLYAI